MKTIKEFIADAVCLGIEKYMKKYRFGLNGMIEITPMTHEQFEEHLYKVFQDNEERVRDYLDTAPTTAPQDVQVTKYTCLIPCSKEGIGCRRK